jgi:hypothetical protein
MDTEHEEIAKDKADGEALTWEDLSKMKFTWRVTQETLRIVPPVVGGFRTALEDIEYDGYLIPKGWQVNDNLNVYAVCNTNLQQKDDATFIVFSGVLDGK